MRDSRPEPGARLPIGQGERRGTPHRPERHREQADTQPASCGGRTRPTRTRRSVRRGALPQRTARRADPKTSKSEKGLSLNLPENWNLDQIPRLTRLRYGNPFCEECRDVLQPGWLVAWWRVGTRTAAGGRRSCAPPATTTACVFGGCDAATPAPHTATSMTRPPNERRRDDEGRAARLGEANPSGRRLSRGSGQLPGGRRRAARCRRVMYDSNEHE